MKSSEGIQILGTGTATALRLMIATVVVAGAYVGATKAADARAETKSESSAHLVTLSARSVPVETSQVPQYGTVTVSRMAGATACDQTYRAQSYVAADSSYDWRLQRWNSGTGAWQSYLAGTGGFAGHARAIRWSPHVVDNPGWYRVRLEISGTTYTSDKFQVSC
jgi:hypothetical protein